MLEMKLRSHPPSYFAAKLGELIERRQLRPSEAARLTGVTEVKISRWLSGKQTYVSPEDMEAFCLNLAHTEVEKAELIRAHLQDECGPGSKLISITIGDSSSACVLRNDDTPPPLPPKLEETFKILRENINDPDLREILISLADLVTKRNPTSEAHPPKPTGPVRAADRLTREERQ
jgi:transcriptional regulator with XRE-family HTH domain